MERKYPIEVSGQRIGYTCFEFADVPMGVLHGKIIFELPEPPYRFFKEHCLKHKVQIYADYPDEQLIHTEIIPQLKVFLPNKEKLQGWGGDVAGMDDEFEINFSGVSGDFIEVEFPHHFNAYYGSSESDDN